MATDTEMGLKFVDKI